MTKHLEHELMETSKSEDMEQTINELRQSEFKQCQHEHFQGSILKSMYNRVYAILY